MFRVEEAIARAKQSGRKITKKELAAELWPEAQESSQIINICKLCKGTTKRIDPEWVPKICQICGVSADFLFGITND